VVLIAEDDASAAQMLETLLGKVGYQVRIAPDGAAALRMVEEAPAPDVLLLDWILPEVTGLDVCRRIRQRFDALTLPILMITAKTDTQSIAAAFDAGASDYLTKPADADQILAALGLAEAEAAAELPAPTTNVVPSLERVEWEHIQRVLTDCGGNVTHAARVLGVHRRTLQRKLAIAPRRR